VKNFDDIFSRFDTISVCLSNIASTPTASRANVQ